MCLLRLLVLAHVLCLVVGVCPGETPTESLKITASVSLSNGLCASFYSTKPQNKFYDAQDLCVKNGGTLLEIHDSVIYNEISAVKSLTNNYWIGLVQVDSKDTCNNDFTCSFQWITELNNSTCDEVKIYHRASTCQMMSETITKSQCLQRGCCNNVQCMTPLFDTARPLNFHKFKGSFQKTYKKYCVYMDVISSGIQWRYRNCYDDNVDAGHRIPNFACQFAAPPEPSSTELPATTPETSTFSEAPSTPPEPPKTTSIQPTGEPPRTTAEPRKLSSTTEKSTSTASSKTTYADSTVTRSGTTSKLDNASSLTAAKQFRIPILAGVAATVLLVLCVLCVLLIVKFRQRRRLLTARDGDVTTTVSYQRHLPELPVPENAGFDNLIYGEEREKKTSGQEDGIYSSISDENTQITFVRGYSRKNISNAHNNEQV